MRPLTSRVPWLALLIPLGWLPAYLGAPRPGVVDTLLLVAATALAFFGADALSRAPWIVGAGGAGDRRPSPVVRFGWPVAIVALAVVWAVLVTGASLARVEALGRKEAFSVGIFQQALWWTGHGVPLGATYSTTDGSLHSQFGIHFSPFLLLLEPLYRWRPEAQTLLFAQALALALAALPLYALARRRIDRGGAALLALAWLLHPTILGAPLTGFHDLAFAPFFIFAAFWAIARERGFLYIFALLGLLTLREDLALVVAFIGVAALFLRAPGRYGFGAILLGGAWFYYVTANVMPGYRPAELTAAPDVFLRQYLGAFGETPAAIVSHLIANPMDFARRLFSREALLYAATLLRPLGLVVPLPDPSWLAALPTLLLNMVSEGATLKSPIGRYSLPVVAALFAALPGAIHFWGRRFGGPPPAAAQIQPQGATSEERGASLRAQSRSGDLWSGRSSEPDLHDLRDGRRGAPLLAVVLSATLLSLLLLPIGPQFRAAPRADRADQEAILAAVPDTGAVVAPDWAFSRLANRPVYACIGSLEERILDPKILERFDVVVLDMAAGSFELERYPTLLPALLERLRGSSAFREAATAGGLHLFVRTARGGSRR
jgi:uncharacterized membrane protein